MISCTVNYFICCSCVGDMHCGWLQCISFLIGKTHGFKIIICHKYFSDIQLSSKFTYMLFIQKFWSKAAITLFLVLHNLHLIISYKKSYICLFIISFPISTPTISSYSIKLNKDTLCIYIYIYKFKKLKTKEVHCISL